MASTEPYFDRREIRSPDQRHEQLTAAIRAQIKHARDNTEAYKNLFQGIDFDQIQSLEDLVGLPVTRKSSLIELQEKSPPFGGFTAIAEGELEYIFSSPGPIYEPQTRRPDYWRFGRALYAAGMRAGDLIHNSFSYHLTPAGAMFDSGCRAIGASIVPGGVGQTEQQLESLGALKPSGYSGTPSFLKILLDKSREEGGNIDSIKNALVSGEAFPTPLREAFLEYGINAVQCYATADLGLIAYESSSNSGLILDEDVYVEIVRPGTGDPVAEGEIGEVVVTTLNPDYPLVRFATGDMSAMLAGISDCGRTNKRIKGWMGRADQTAKVRGMFIHPQQIARLVDRHPDIHRARLVVEWLDQADTMTLHCETPLFQSDNAAGLSAKIADSIRQVCKVRGEVTLVAPDSLPRDGVVIEDSRKYD